jgi:hypothetical protein
MRDLRDMAARRNTPEQAGNADNADNDRLGTRGRELGILIFAGIGGLLVLALILSRIIGNAPGDARMQAGGLVQAQTVPARWTPDGSNIPGGVLFPRDPDALADIRVLDQTPDGGLVFLAVAGGGEVWVARQDVPAGILLPPAPTPKPTSTPMPEPTSTPLPPTPVPLPPTPTRYTAEGCATVKTGEHELTRCVTATGPTYAQAQAIAKEIALAQAQQAVDAELFGGTE